MEALRRTIRNISCDNLGAPKYEAWALVKWHICSYRRGSDVTSTKAQQQKTDISIS